ncbi:hypothetical protein [Streptomyces tropicalis]|uniref:HEAT repeat domain-containing protein n=1 Tax=Streptomyces tropicalis TaxID=3034234 RepID=A0ABT5ZZH4_9ACTN|nr:hypothetical protein [Streptomyces tropicalis]MDF3297792.1 hypothetical protein [Streptomyces tropicalis]
MGESPAVRAARLRLPADPEAEVREAACRAVADGTDRDPGLLDAPAVLLDDAVRAVRVAAVRGLARHDDERCVEGARRLPPRPGPPARRRPRRGAALRVAPRRPLPPRGFPGRPGRCRPTRSLP